MSTTNCKAFTILEIIIVVVIVSVLMSLAIPKFSKVIERSRGTEGITMLMTIRGAMERCYLMTRSYLACMQNLGPGPSFSFNSLGIDDPGAAVNSHFYVSGFASVLPPRSGYHFIVTRNSNELLIPDTGGPIMVICPDGSGSGTTGKSQIAMCVSETSVDIIGSGFYKGIK